MKPAGILIALIVAFASGSLTRQAASQPQPDIGAADRLFQAGKFAEAGAVYEQIVARNANDHAAIIQLGRVALLANRLQDAQRWFERALTLKPGDTDAKVMLAEAFYRRDDFQRAAAALTGVDVSSNKLVLEQYPTLNVAKLKSFDGQIPYEVLGSGPINRVKLIKTEPLPIVSVRVNGGQEVTFFIDTGGSEVALDTDFARELGMPVFGTGQGTFSGGQHASVQQGRIESLTIGDWSIRNLPVVTLALRQLSTMLGVKRIDGVIGTTLFYHFLTTLDFPNGELVLRRGTPEMRQQFAASLGKSVAVPFWMASDHFMVAWGHVDSLPPTLLFVDTGLAGAGVKLAQSVIKQGGIKLEEDKASVGKGGGGTLKVVPYTVRQLSFGDATEHNVAGLYDGPFPWENTFGFHLAGMVGHDFFKRYAVTFDFQNMRILLQR